MKFVLKISATTAVLMVLLIADIPLVPVELVPEAQAIFGVRRRTAVVAYSAGAAQASSSAAASQQAQVAQQQAATAQQQAEVAQQQAATAQQQTAAAQQPPQTAASHTVSTVPIGTVVPALPGGCVAVTVANSQYQDCGGTFYKAAFQGKNLVYVTVNSPL